MVDNLELERIEFHALRFREALESTHFGKDAGNLRHFPKNCCHHASELLKRYLREKGLGEFETTEGNHPTNLGEHHVWLRKEGIVVDITADQFGRDKVIVARDSDWHDSLDGEPVVASDPEQRRRDLWEGDGGWEGYNRFYSSILESMEDAQD